ncbi:unnamed protein product [Prunus armeniaca]|uniref:Uncharacterized protein n=1 Tax=Prunus armeniaca TaxID=36596 RepID=A0A6J5UH92_PRUAR|nr:unnamed protein product [Prunus armeniaca]
MAIDKCYMLQLGKIDFQLLCSNLERLILNYSIAGNAAKKISSASTALPKKRLLIKTNHSTMTASRKASMAYDSSSNEDDDEIPKRDLVNNTVMAEVNEAVVVALGNDDQGTYRWDFKNYGLIEDSGRI